MAKGKSKKPAETRAERMLREARAVKYWLDRDDWLSGRKPMIPDDWILRRMTRTTDTATPPLAPASLKAQHLEQALREAYPPHGQTSDRVKDIEIKLMPIYAAHGWGPSPKRDTINRKLGRRPR
ncbi:hypothetical protein ACMA5K_05765 [Bradyrhizobium diazoefficiens]|uniref:hypothetical protein n=1 Tax=Bradyrhizobium diazoefficiens TaxID=1355477 RepID=UPI0015B61D72|nr:hypothetical protein [Bradyrhizobium diazoefficiens]QLD40522.1 hypothetical protein HUW42_05705 [Bradyrhizobium diazoefficiens]